MIIRCGLVLLFISCVKTTTSNIFDNELVRSSDGDRIFSYSFWPSMHNGAKMMKLRKRQVQHNGNINEGGDLHESKTITPPPDLKPLNNAAQSATPTAKPEANTGNDNKNNNKNSIPNGNPNINETRAGTINGTVNGTGNETVNGTNSGTGTDNATAVQNNTIIQTVVSGNNSKLNETVAKTTAMDLNKPGVLTRALIVFGGFALMAGAYLIFYKKKGKHNDTSSTHGINDANQFRYGILQSDDRRDNLELSRVPLTMESDEDEDDDLEIFDLEQKKKSLSYVNLQTNDEEVVFSNSENTRNDRDNLLLDIEDASLDTLINWSSNGNKSIL